MNLQFLFNTPISEAKELHPGYEDHASNIWQVRTDDQEFIVRSSRLVGKPDNKFW